MLQGVQTKVYDRTLLQSLALPSYMLMPAEAAAARKEVVVSWYAHAKKTPCSGTRMRAKAGVMPTALRALASNTQ